MAFLDKEQVKELLYLELELSREIEQVTGHLKKAGHDLKALGEALEKDPLLVALTQSGDTVNRDNHVSLNLLVEYSRAYSFTIILAELVNLRRKRELLADVQKTLYPVRNPVKP